MSIKSVISGLFGTGGTHSKDSSSGQLAKDRLIFILKHDRVDIGPGRMDLMRQDIIEVIKKYLEINESEIEMKLEKEEGSTALLATIPISSSRSGCSYQK
jgi:cell division topological specificity factor